MPLHKVGRYEILRQIASGGMASVYLGRVVGAGGFQRLVAIKVMHEFFAEDAHAVAMFLDEARLAAGIRHQNVVATLDVEKGPDRPFMVLEYVDGPSLHVIQATVAKQKETIPIGITIRMFLDALAGLHAAHELTGTSGAPLGLVHRDVTPHNVLVGRDGITRITDFGVARAQARIAVTRESRLKGKLPYMSREHARGEQVDRRTDIYSAGIVLWEMLTGKRLFQAENDAALLGAVLEGPRHSPRAVNPQVPWAIDDACMRALEEPQDRYPTAKAFAEGLVAAANTANVAVASPAEVGAFATRVEESRGRQLPTNLVGAGAPHASTIGASLDHGVVGLPSTPPEAYSRTATGLGTVMRFAKGRSRRSALLAALAGSLITGTVVWFAAHSAGDDRDEDTIGTPAAIPVASAAVSTTPEASASVAPDLAPPPSASSSAPAEPSPTAKPRVWHPRKPRPAQTETAGPTEYRPNEP